MKTVIYYNVTTGDSYDQEGTLRTKNNPFTAYYGEHHTFEWHLIDSYDPGISIAENTPRTAWEITPQTASIAADDNYLAAHPAALKESAAAGCSAVSLISDPVSGKIPPTGFLRFFRTDLSTLIIPYTAVNDIPDGFVFAADIPETETDFSAGSRVDIMEEPLIYAPALNTGNSQIEQGIFSFDLTLTGWRLAEKMEYSDIDSLTAKGLELCISGTEPESENSIILLRCQVPFTIKNVISLSFL